MPHAAAPPRPRSFHTVLNFRRWDCINAGQRKTANKRRFAACTSLLTSQPHSDRRQSAGLFADRPGVHCRDRLRAGGGRIRTLGPPSEGCMQTPRSPRIASSGDADRPENGENADLHRCVISAADHPLRQQTRPRACVCLTRKASCREDQRHFGCKIPGVVKNSSRQPRADA
jgi:hypothetical protein